MRKLFVTLVIILLGVAYFSNKEITSTSPLGKRTPAQAVAYARAQLGKAYVWATQGPDTFDCSGLTYRAWKLPQSQRTSEQQWNNQRHVPHSRPGDLVYFHGILVGNEVPPGHVGIVIGEHKMIDGYGNGTEIRVESFGLPDSAPGLNKVMGFTRP